MPRTPDRQPGVSDEEAIQLEPTSPATTSGEVRFDGTKFSMYDAAKGEFDPRVGNTPDPTVNAQLLVTQDGSSWETRVPLVGINAGWLTNASGRLLVEGSLDHGN